MSDQHRPSEVSSCLIWGGWYGSRNIGDTAILLGLKDLIGQANPDHEVYVRALSTDVDYTCTNAVTGVRALIKSDVFRIWPWLHILRVFRSVDKVIVSGGTPVFDSSHAIRILYLLLPVLFRKPFVVFGAGVKPIRSWYGRCYLRFFLRKAKFISVRDQDSKRILEDLGLDGVQLTGDSAFFAKPAPRNDIDELLQRYGVKPNEKVLVVAPRLLSPQKKRLYLEEFMGEEIVRQAPRHIASAIDAVASEFDKIVFLAMHFYGPDSDAPHIRQIMLHSNAGNLIFLKQELRPELALACFRRAHLVLGVRLHALLLAASMGTPIVGIAYEQKVKSLFHRLELDDACLDLFDFTSEELVGKIKTALERHNELASHLQRRVGHIREQVVALAKEALVC